VWGLLFPALSRSLGAGSTRVFFDPRSALRALEGVDSVVGLNGRSETDGSPATGGVPSQPTAAGGQRRLCRSVEFDLQTPGTLSFTIRSNELLGLLPVAFGGPPQDTTLVGAAAGGGGVTSHVIDHGNTC
jgi:hypothetical protein